MSVPIIAMRYAKAFAALTGVGSEGEKQLKALQAVIELFAQPGAAKILKSPVMPLDLKNTLLTYALKQAQAEKLAYEFVATVVEEGRVALLPEIIRAFGTLLGEASGQVKAKLTVACPLNDAELEAIRRQLSSLVHKQVEVHAEVNAEILGGFIARIGHLLIDLSLRTKLEAFTSNAALI